MVAHIEALQKENTPEPLDAFASPVDRKIAFNLINRLETTFLSGLITPYEYSQAMQSIDLLIPHFTSDGKRKIGNRILSPQMETLIASRLTSKEVDVTAPDGIWGSLPPLVKNEIIAFGDLQIELTSNCTVRCSFCDVSDKGPIQFKISLSSLQALFELTKKVHKEQGTAGRSDTLYWGTDPFDAKWNTPNGEADFRDVAEMYWQTMKGVQRHLYTSTAVPLGEEFRVIDFADRMITHLDQKDIDPENKFRISMTNANKERVEAIKNILSALHGHTRVKNHIPITENRHEHIARRGAAWNNGNNALTLWDIVGPECADTVVLRPTSIDTVIMVGASNEWPSGQMRKPLIEKIDGGEQYVIPRYSTAPTRDLENKDITSFYPDVHYNLIGYTDDGGFVGGEEDNENIHRVLRRVAGVLYFLSKWYGKELQTMPLSLWETFDRRFGRDCQKLQQYLNAGHTNDSMAWVLQLIEKRKKELEPPPLPFD